MTTAHADYLAVPESRRWGAPLGNLFPVLRKEAWGLRGGWAWRCLPHGALVAVRIVPPEEGKLVAFATELRVSRREAPTDDEGWRKWNAELATFLKFFGGAGDWEQTVRSQEKAEAVFRFRLRGESSVKCARCGTGEVQQPGLFATDLCATCATELGSEDIVENARRRGS